MEKRIEFEKPKLPERAPKQVADKLKISFLKRFNSIMKIINAPNIVIDDVQEDDNFYFIIVDFTEEQWNKLPHQIKDTMIKDIN